MFTDKIKKFVADGFTKTVNESKRFEKEHKKISDEIDSFTNEMKDWSKKRRIIRNK